MTVAGKGISALPVQTNLGVIGQPPSDDFASREVHSWSEFAEIVREHGDGWVYRGQRQGWDLKPTLERAIENWSLDQSIGPELERQLIRAFLRVYEANDLAKAEVDTLYCLSLMQHHGAPTRLLDFSYSPFVAAKFAIEAGGVGSVIWCLNRAWSYRSAQAIVGDAVLRDRNTDIARDDKTFKSLCGMTAKSQKLVFLENPLKLTSRLSVQQGIFLCPGDISVSFHDNLREMSDFKEPHSVIKLRLLMKSAETHEFTRLLRRMNITSTALFPGVDGLARSLGENLLLYASLAEAKTGSPDHL
jgi:hypothetical protein